MASSEGKCIRFSRSGAVDWELKKKYFSVKQSRLKALKKWENSRYYPPKDVQDRLDRLLMTNYHTKLNETCDMGNKNQGAEFVTSPNPDQTFVKGLIIKMRIRSPQDKVLDEPSLRKALRSMSDQLNISIAYIDLKDTSGTLFKEDGSIERSGFIRLNSSENANKLFENLEMDEIINKSILTGDDEVKYWTRMKDCQDNQKSKKRRNR